jgi:hypothetical protein
MTLSLRPSAILNLELTSGSVTVAEFRPLYNFPPSSGLPSAVNGDAELSFATAELPLNMGYVAARVGLLRLVHRGDVSDVGLVRRVLAALPRPANHALARERLLVRLAEPITGAGMVMFPMSWESGGLASGPLPMADLRLTLRADGAGQTFIRLAGTIWQPGDAELARRAIMASAGDWLSRLAEVLTGAQTAGY